MQRVKITGGNMAKKTLTENFSLNLIKTMMGILFPLITFPYASRILGSAGIGKVNYSESIIGYFSLFAGLGISAYGIREAAKYRDDKEKLNKLVNELFTINLITASVTYIVLLVMLFNFQGLAGYKYIMLIQSAGIIFTTLGMDWLFTALEEYRYITLRAVIFQFISLILLFILVRDSDDYCQYAAVCTFAGVGSGFMNFFYLRKFITVRLSFSKKILNHMKPVMYIFGTNLASSVYLDLDRTMLGIFSGDIAVGLYSSAVKITKTITLVLSCISNVALPRISYYIKQKKQKELEQLILTAGNFTLILSVPIAVGIFCLSKEMIMVFSGSGFINAYIPLCILGVDIVIAAVNRILAWLVLVPLGYENKVLFTTAMGGVSNFLLNILFISKWGIIGASVSTCISEIIVLILCLCYCKGHIKLKKLFVYVPLYLLISFLFFAIKPFVSYYFSGNLARILIQVAASSVIYFGILYILKNPYISIVVDKIKSFKHLRDR